MTHNATYLDLAALLLSPILWGRLGKSWSKGGIQPNTVKLTDMVAIEGGGKAGRRDSRSQGKSMR